MSKLSVDEGMYRDAGYCVVPNLIPQDLICAARKRLEQIVTDRPTWSAAHFQDLDPSRCPGDEPVPAGIQRPALEEDTFARIAEHPRLAEAMGTLLEGPVELFTDQLGVKHGWIDTEQGGRSYFHQDSWYWKVEPELGCNCWIPLHDVDVDAIALAVMPGSQQGWQLTTHESYYDDPSMGSVVDGEFQPFKRHRIADHDVDLSKEQLVHMQPGDGLFFTNYTWHRSEPNRSGQTKAFYAIAWQRAES
ncbi:MAG: phytanoyl-CoA dioxygenase family protein [Candidatus Latescibacterota bacterium]|nr:phytanoyl-CoA dioxygenase family protein [Candidatus Latescibacterota bacterium]